MRIAAYATAALLLALPIASGAAAANPAKASLHGRVVDAKGEPLGEIFVTAPTRMDVAGTGPQD